MSLLLAARRNTFWNTKQFPIAPNPERATALLKIRNQTLSNMETTCSNSTNIQTITTNIAKDTLVFKKQYKNYQNSLFAYQNNHLLLNKLSKQPTNCIDSYFRTIASYQLNMTEIQNLLEQIEQVKTGALAFDQIEIMDNKLGEQYWNCLEEERRYLYNDPDNPYPMKAKLSSLFIIVACTAAAIATSAILGEAVIVCAIFGIIACLASCLIAYVNFNLICALPHYALNQPSTPLKNTDFISNTTKIELTFNSTDLTPELVEKIEVTSNDDNKTISISLKTS